MSAYCSTTRDLTIYLVLSRYRDGLFWAERDAARCDKRTTIEDIRTGQFSEVVQVIELNVSEFSARDVTEDIMEAVKHEAAIRYEPQDVDHQANKFDHARDLLKHGVHGW